MSAKTVNLNTQSKAKMTSLLSRAIRFIEEKTATLMLMFDRNDYFNSSNKAVLFFVSLEYVVLVAYCFNQQTILDWRLSPFTSRLVSFIQSLDPTFQIGAYFSFEKYVTLIGCLMAIFVVVVALLILVLQSRVESGGFISKCQTLIKLTAPLLFVFLHSPFLRLLVSIVDLLDRMFI